MSFMKRAESMRIDGSGKKLRRTPSFTTRRRTQSFRKLKGSEASPPNLSAVEIYGYLDRKQELQTGGRRATVRSWKMYYTVLCGQLLCFFKDEDDFAESKAAAPPLNLYHATCEKAQDYTKKKNVFRLHTTDGSEYLFMAEDEKMLEEWVVKISFHANLTPSLQLTSYDSQLDPNAEKENYRKPEHISTATINIVQKDEQIRTPLRNSEPPASYTYNGNNVPNVDYYQHNKRISADNYAKAIEPPPLPMNPPPNRTASNMHQDHFWKNENAVDADSSKRQIKMYQSDRAELRNRPFDVSLNAQSKAHQYPDERRPVTEDENKKDRRSNSVLHGLFKRRKGTHV